MKKLWYDEIFNIINKVLLVKVPFEIVHFPETGVHSALGIFADLGKNDPEFPTKCFYIDLRSFSFYKDPDENKAAFLRLLKTYIEIYSDLQFEDRQEGNLFRSLETLILKYLQQRKKVVFIFEVSSQVNIKEIHVFWDILIFLDRMRFSHNGNVNFIVSTSVPIFSAQNPPPVAIVTQYFDYFKPAKIFSSINEDVLEQTYRKHTNDNVIKLVELCGGLVSVAKNLIRDFIMLDKKIAELDSLEVTGDFFEIYVNCKARLDRICHQLTPVYRKTLGAIVMGGEIEKLDPYIIEYFKKTGIIDETGQVRGVILRAYIEKYITECASESEDKQNIELVDSQFTDAVPEAIISIQDSIQPDQDPDTVKLPGSFQVNIKSGEIYKNNLPQQDYLTENELKVFNLLFQKGSDPVNREEIAQTIWVKSSVNDYSDWAIDKIVSRIREKLHDEKPYRLIRTVRGIGFQMLR